ncbi:steryl-sulfatase-like isoform X2 [Ptychodera flava]|uniref:steryl-sulfatase-like isoform X2 n=1 Tax=Ptychodera flava TaxID=63121 RepID=UPI00396A647E
MSACMHIKTMKLASCTTALFLLTVLVLAKDDVSTTKKPNFLIFLVDDLGMGDVGCFGNDTIRTPNIDRLASEGVKLTHNMVPAPTCTPSRAALLTGRYPIRAGLASKTVNTMFGCNACTGGMPPYEITFAEVLKEAGYETAYLGKWHLGIHSSYQDYAYLPNNQGFDYYYGMPFTKINECADPPNGRSSVMQLMRISKLIYYWATLTVVLYSFVFVSKWFNIVGFRGSLIMFVSVTLFSYLLLKYPESSQRFLCILMKNHEVVEQPIRLENMTVRFTNQATSFIRENKEKPFLLMMAYVKVHTALFTSKQFAGVSRHGQYGDNVEEMDWSVGKILDALDQNGLKDNTFVYFTSDHGGHIEEVAVEKGREGEREGGWNGIYKGGKSQVWEGGVRVPTVARYPPSIPSNTVISVPTSTMDILPTIAKIAGAKVPDDRIIDGREMTGMLFGKDKIAVHDFFFIYCGPWIHGVTFRPDEEGIVYKVIFTTPKWTQGTQACFHTWLCQCKGRFVDQHDPPLVFDLTNDPGEHHPLKLTGETKALIQKAKAARDRHEKAVEPVTDQFSLYRSVLFRPWLQPCCNFPYCSCKEDNTDM